MAGQGKIEVSLMLSPEVFELIDKVHELAELADESQQYEAQKIVDESLELIHAATGVKRG